MRFGVAALFTDGGLATRMPRRLGCEIYGQAAVFEMCPGSSRVPCVQKMKDTYQNWTDLRDLFRGRGRLAILAQMYDDFVRNPGGLDE